MKATCEQPFPNFYIPFLSLFFFTLVGSVSYYSWGGAILFFFSQGSEKVS